MFLLAYTDINVSGRKLAAMVPIVSLMSFDYEAVGRKCCRLWKRGDERRSSINATATKIKIKIIKKEKELSEKRCCFYNMLGSMDNKTVNHCVCYHDIIVVIS